VFARRHRRLEVIGMPVGRARDEDGVHGRGQELVVRVRALEEHGRIEGREALLGRLLVELVLRLGQAVVEEVVEGHDAEAGVHQVLADPVAAPAAADDPEGHRIARGSSEGRARLHEHHPRGRRRRRLDELAPLHGLPPSVWTS
jgi:hypothetical protein